MNCIYCNQNIIEQDYYYNNDNGQWLKCKGDFNHFVSINETDGSYYIKLFDLYNFEEIEIYIANNKTYIILYKNLHNTSKYIISQIKYKDSLNYLKKFMSLKVFV